VLRSMLKFTRSAAAIVAAIVSAGVATACGGSSVTAPATGTPVTNNVVSFPGFDISLYPGDAAMRAWVSPASPYYWAGYYLAAPCHRDTSWTNKFAILRGMGWGITAIYVGQQDWSQIPQAAAARAGEVSQQLITCSASLLSDAQGVSEAADAVAKLRADGFPDRSIIFLDVEPVTVVTPALLEYYRAWIGAVVRDGRYRPGVYASKQNAMALYTAAVEAVHSAGATEAPTFWIASSAGFTQTAAPTAVGFDFARLWQGAFDVVQTWNGVKLTVDVDVATTKSPSTP
jgi:hypothetical protein